jgi:hypothetical protein
MNKKAKPIFLLLGIIFSLLGGIVIGRAMRYKNSPALALIPGISIRSTSTQFQSAQATAAPEQFGNEPTAESSPPEQSLGKDQNWMKFGELNLLEGELGFYFISSCDGGVNISILPVEVTAWHPEVFEGEEFGIGKNVAVAWEHLGYAGLWIHSGWDFWAERSPATDLQYFIETDALNEVQPLQRIETRLNECLRGSQVSLDQQGQTYSGEVAAAVRVPAVGVEELSKHTMDLVPYLAQTYPESGFADLDEDTLLIYFCGRAALDELTDPNAGYWTQTRFVIAIEPKD